MDGLPINLSTDVHSVYATINVKSYQSRTKGALRREHGERSTYPVSLGVGLGGPETSVTLARQALALGYLMFCGHLWMPHCGHGHKAGSVQSLHECITRKGCRDVCSAQQPVNKYATHVFLHKCRVTGLLWRGKGKSAET